MRKKYEIVTIEIEHTAGPMYCTGGECVSCDNLWHKSTTDTITNNNANI